MGFVMESTPEMGEYSVEVRSESFYLSGEFAPHCIYVYDGGAGHGTAEILIEDIPKIRAALDAVETHLAKDCP